jgi:hypothetical protein
MRNLRASEIQCLQAGRAAPCGHEVDVDGCGAARMSSASLFGARPPEWGQILPVRSQEKRASRNRGGSFRGGGGLTVYGADHGWTCNACETGAV